MKNLILVLIASATVTLTTGCGIGQPVSFGETASSKSLAIDCNSADLEVTAEQIQTEINSYQDNCLEVPVDLIEAEYKVNACAGE